MTHWQYMKYFSLLKFYVHIAIRMPLEFNAGVHSSLIRIQERKWA